MFVFNPNTIVQLQPKETLYFARGVNRGSALSFTYITAQGGMSITWSIEKLWFRTMSPVQALDGAFNQENREKCKAATGPLIEAVDNLTAFASNPEFASIPAQISPEVRCWFLFFLI